MDLFHYLVHIRSVHLSSISPGDVVLLASLHSITYPADITPNRRPLPSTSSPILSRIAMPISDDEDSSSTAGDLDLFDEPEDWKPKEKPCTFQTYLLEEKDERGVVTQTREIKLRFVGSSPLWVSILFVWCMLCWKGDRSGYKK